MKKRSILLTLLFISISLHSNNNSFNLVPKPKQIIVGQELFTIDKECVIITSKGVSNFNNQYLRDKLNPVFRFNFNITTNRSSDKFILLDLSPDLQMEEEGYRLTIAPEGVTILASTNAGIFYGIQTLLQLMPPEVYSGKKADLSEYSISAMEIDDAPRFSYRGGMLDVSRTFFDLDFIYRYIDWLAYHKINTFHWHLADDNGWRVEIKKYPELTSKGAWRGLNEVLPPVYGSGAGRYGGFYTQAEIKEVVKYAQDRNIEIIPEIDLPGHSKSVTATYPEVLCNTDVVGSSAQGEIFNVFCVAREENYTMLDNIIKELTKLFPSQYFNIGGDEVDMIYWANCDECQALMKKEGMEKVSDLQHYFVKRMEKIVTKHGKRMIGWDEIIEGGELEPTTAVVAWRNMKTARESLKKGQPTVMQIAEYLYVDMKYTPAERGHNWAAIIPLDRIYSFNPAGFEDLTAEEEALILGPQAGLWAELLIRPPRFAESQLYPRLCALSEMGWTPQEMRDFNDFESRLYDKHFERLYNMDIAFRIAPPVIEFKDNLLKVSSPHKSIPVRYTIDGSSPNYSSPIYKGEIVTDNPDMFRFAAFYHDLKSIDVKIDSPEKYIYPEVTIETNIGFHPRFPVSNITDYNYNTYMRSDRRVNSGDYLTYIFKEPVKAKKIGINTGIPNITFYGVTYGHVEYSYDGVNWIKGNDFKLDTAEILNPERDIKSVRIVITGPNDAHIVAFQDLVIE